MSEGSERLLAEKVVPFLKGELASIFHEELRKLAVEKFDKKGGVYSDKLSEDVKPNSAEQALSTQGRQSLAKLQSILNGQRLRDAMTPHMAKAITPTLQGYVEDGFEDRLSSVLMSMSESLASKPKAVGKQSQLVISAIDKSLSGKAPNQREREALYALLPVLTDAALERQMTALNDGGPLETVSSVASNNSNTDLSEQERQSFLSTISELEKKLTAARDHIKKTDSGKPEEVAKLEGEILRLRGLFEKAHTSKVEHFPSGPRELKLVYFYGNQALQIKIDPLNTRDQRLLNKDGEDDAGVEDIARTLRNKAEPRINRPGYGSYLNERDAENNCPSVIDCSRRTAAYIKVFSENPDPFLVPGKEVGMPIWMPADDKPFTLVERRHLLSVEGASRQHTPHEQYKTVVQVLAESPDATEPFILSCLSGGASIPTARRLKLSAQTGMSADVFDQFDAPQRITVRAIARLSALYQRHQQAEISVAFGDLVQYAVEQLADRLADKKSRASADSLFLGAIDENGYLKDDLAKVLAEALTAEQLSSLRAEPVHSASPEHVSLVGHEDSLSSNNSETQLLGGGALSGNDETAQKDEAPRPHRQIASSSTTRSKLANVQSTSGEKRLKYVLHKVESEGTAQHTLQFENLSPSQEAELVAYLVSFADKL
ncbi:hypothetical protein [Aliagarivorans taiwanensis]|uniref:hypothetical protein n=1 Tax=Aliagarivorans taiwanensis TaxID=561966 RepID=UPI0004147742|nr:hypothetical protein [Aliagarivorans taiwanensis]